MLDTIRVLVIFTCGFISGDLSAPQMVVEPQCYEDAVARIDTNPAHGVTWECRNDD